MVILRVLVENKTAELLHLWIQSALSPEKWEKGSPHYREVLPGPDFGHVEGVKAQLVWIGIFGVHDLHVGFPHDLLSILNSVPELALRVVWIFTRDSDCFWLSELLLAVLSQKVVLDVDKFPLLVDPTQLSANRKPGE